MGPLDAACIRENTTRVRARVAESGGDPAAVTIVAVTKAHDVSVARAALDAGLVDLAENYAQDLLAKAAAFAAEPPAIEPRWHFIGRLQTNKVRALAPHVHLWQSVDRAALAQEIARRAPGAAVLVQLNLSGEAHKGGCEPGDVDEIVAACRSGGLDVRGLMGVGPAGAPDGARSGFRILCGAADRLGLAVRSMGMSRDLEVAVQEGSTMIRVGADLFTVQGSAPGPE